MSDDTQMFAGLRVAYEHMIAQGLTPGQASNAMTIFGAGMAYRAGGLEMAREVLHSAMDDVARMAVADGVEIPANET
jgi:hypothetical protein